MAFWTAWIRVPSIEPLTSTTNTVATGRPPSFLSFQTFWTSISVDPDGTSTVGSNAGGSNPNSAADCWYWGCSANAANASSASDCDGVRSPTAYSGLSWRTPNGMNSYPDWSDSVFA